MEYRELALPDTTVTSDPVTLARQHYSQELPNPVTVEQIEQRMLEWGVVCVLLTVDNLKDDASRAWRYRLTFKPLDVGGWKLVRVERKHQCWRGPPPSPTSGPSGTVYNSFGVQDYSEEEDRDVGFRHR